MMRPSQAPVDRAVTGPSAPLASRDAGCYGSAMSAAEPATDVKATYEAWWSATRDAVDGEIAAGETELSRLMHRAFARTVGARPKTEQTSIIFHREAPAPYLAGHRIARDWIADTVIEHAVRTGADALIETGSGWGYNLFNIWLRGGPQLPCHAFEYTQAGRETCMRLRDAAWAGPQVEVHAFDYYAADLSAVAGRYRRPLIYTSHSIEQIGVLPQSCIDAFLGAADEVTVLHFEPVSWQFAPDEEASRSVLKHCQRSGYNTNLWPLLQANAADGRLVIEETEANVMAPKLTNSSSLIRWRKAASA
jgi:hypothetical protein